MSSSKYYTMIRAKDHKYDLRLRMVCFARSHGIHATARRFGCSRNTVRKWLRRYQRGGRSGLRELSRAPHNCPHKTCDKIEKKVLKARKRSGFGGERLVREFGLPCSAGAAKRILRQNKLTRKPRRKHQTKNDLRKVKAKLPAFEHFQMDTKPLFDIPEYYPYIKRLGLPRHQYSIREVPTGARSSSPTPRSSRPPTRACASSGSSNTCASAAKTSPTSTSTPTTAQSSEAVRNASANAGSTHWSKNRWGQTTTSIRPPPPTQTPTSRAFTTSCKKSSSNANNSSPKSSLLPP